MTKSNFVAEHRIHVMKNAGSRKSLFTMHLVIFNPNKAPSTETVKRRANQHMHISLKKLKEEYDVIYAFADKERMGRVKVWTFVPAVKPAANAIFVIPKKHRKAARKAIAEYFVAVNS